MNKNQNKDYWDRKTTMVILYFTRSEELKKTKNEVEIFNQDRGNKIIKLVQEINTEKEEEGTKDILETSESSSPYLESLAPKVLEGKERKKISAYLEALKYGLQSDDITNIALMGPYGSGKSSILKTFQKENEDDFNFLNLSLGAFSEESMLTHETDQTDTESKSGDGSKINNGKTKDSKKIKQGTIINWEKLENSIVKQMVYRPRAKDVPFSRFKRIASIDFSDYMVMTITVFLWSISVMFFNNTFEIKNKIHYLGRMLNSFFSTNIKFQTFDFFVLLIFLCVSGMMIHRILVLITTTINISSIGTKDIELEVSKNSNSYFSKMIDEIFYFFESTKYNVVVFEDIDRFGSIEIFEHIRELNFLLTESKQIDRKITFIYAVRENIFEDVIDEYSEEKESTLRTKFFELIIAVIPVVDSFNSKEYLKPIMEKKYPELFSEKKNEFGSFLKDISLYIDDLRLLKNIVNEFTIYKDVIGNLSYIDLKKLFSIIVFKNILPSEYAELQKNKGQIYELLKGVEIRKSYTEVLMQQQEELLLEKNRIKELKKIDVLKELKQYLFDQGVPGKSTFIMIDGKQYNNPVYNQDTIDLIVSSKDKGDIQFYKNGYISLKKEQILTLGGTVESLSNYSSDKLKEKMDINIKQIENVENELESKNLKSLAEILIEEPSLQDNIKFKENENNDLVLFLLTNGLLAEDYDLYMSIFYESILSKNDKEFILKVKGHQTFDFDYKLDNISEIIIELNLQDYSKRGIINKSILLFIFKNEINIESYRKEIEEFGKLFKKLSVEENIDILFRICKETTMQETKEFIKWYTQVRYIDIDLFEGDKDDLLKRVFFSATEEELIRELTVSENNSFKKYISNISNFFPVIRNSCEFDQLEIILLNEQVQDEIFVHVDFEDIEEREVELILESKLFAINYNMVFNLLNYNKAESQVPNLTNIRQSKSDILISSVLKNLDLYVSKVLSELPEVHESEDNALFLLNNVGKTEKFIEKLHCELEDIMQVRDTNIWGKIFERELVKVNWNNIKYYFENEATENYILKEFVENNITILAQENIELNESENLILLYLVDELEAEVNGNWNSLIEETLFNGLKSSETTKEYLIENGNILFSEAFFGTTQNEETKIKFILEYPSEVLENENFEIPIDIWLRVLEGIRAENTLEVVSKIVLDEENLNNYLEQLIEIIYQRNIQVNSEQLTKIFENCEAPLTLIDFLNNFLENNNSIEISELEEILDMIGKGYREIEVGRRVAHLENNEINEKLVDNLKKYNIVSSKRYSTDKETIIVWNKMT